MIMSRIIVLFGFLCIVGPCSAMWQPRPQIQISSLDGILMTVSENVVSYFPDLRDCRKEDGIPMLPFKKDLLYSIFSIIDNEFSTNEHILEQEILNFRGILNNCQLAEVCQLLNRINFDKVHNSKIFDQVVEFIEGRFIFLAAQIIFGEIISHGTGQVMFGIFEQGLLRHEMFGLQQVWVEHLMSSFIKFYAPCCDTLNNVPVSCTTATTSSCSPTISTLPSNDQIYREPIYPIRRSLKYNGFYVRTTVEGRQQEIMIPLAIVERCMPVEMVRMPLFDKMTWEKFFKVVDNHTLFEGEYSFVENKYLVNTLSIMHSLQFEDILSNLLCDKIISNIVLLVHANRNIRLNNAAGMEQFLSQEFSPGMPPVYMQKIIDAFRHNMFFVTEDTKITFVDLGLCQQLGIDRTMQVNAQEFCKVIKVPDIRQKTLSCLFDILSNDNSDCNSTLDYLKINDTDALSELYVTLEYFDLGNSRLAEIINEKIFDDTALSGSMASRDNTSADVPVSGITATTSSFSPTISTLTSSDQVHCGSIHPIRRSLDNNFYVQTTLDGYQEETMIPLEIAERSASIETAKIPIFEKMTWKKFFKVVANPELFEREYSFIENKELANTLLIMHCLQFEDALSDLLCHKIISNLILLVHANQDISLNNSASIEQLLSQEISPNIPQVYKQEIINKFSTYIFFLTQDKDVVCADIEQCKRHGIGRNSHAYAEQSSPIVELPTISTKIFLCLCDLLENDTGYCESKLNDLKNSDENILHELYGAIDYFDLGDSRIGSLVEAKICGYQDSDGSDGSSSCDNVGDTCEKLVCPPVTTSLGMTVANSNNSDIVMPTLQSGTSASGSPIQSPQKSICTSQSASVQKEHSAAAAHNKSNQKNNSAKIKNKPNHTPTSSRDKSEKKSEKKNGNKKAVESPQKTASSRSNAQKSKITTTQKTIKNSNPVSAGAESVPGMSTKAAATMMKREPKSTAEKIVPPVAPKPQATKVADTPKTVVPKSAAAPNALVKKPTYKTASVPHVTTPKWELHPRVLRWFNNSFTATQSHDSILYHSFPLLIDKYLRRHGAEGKWLDSTNGKYDKVYSLAGEVRGANRNFGVFSVTVNDASMCYHRGFKIYHSVLQKNNDVAELAIKREEATDDLSGENGWHLVCSDSRKQAKKKAEVIAERRGYVRINDNFNNVQWMVYFNRDKHS